MKKFRFLFFILLLGAIAVRLYKFSGPIADWHSWRQSDTAAVARNFLRFGIDPLHPRYDDLSNIQTGKDNPQGWRMVEFPLYQVIGAGLARTNANFTIEGWLRVVTIAASVGTMLFVGLLVAEFVDPATGLIAGALYGFLPYSVYYGRTTLPDPFMVFWAVLSIWLASRGKNILWVLAAGAAGAFALLAKPMAAFLLVPIPYLYFRRFGYSRDTVIRLIIYSIVSLLPLFLWRKWILQFPEGIAVNAWLFNGNGIRFKGAWFYWLFAERLGKLILGYWGLIPLGIGLIVTPSKKEGWVFRWLALGTLLFLVIFATGNVQHDYYQILLLPVVVVYGAKGLAFMIKGGNGISRTTGLAMAFVSVLLSLGFSWYTIRTYYWINRPEIVEAGRAADALLPKDAKVIASYNGDTTFLYQTNRQGWPLGFDIDKKIAMGATAYVTVSPTDNDGETRDLASRFTVLVRNDRFAIIDLTKPK